MRLSRSAESIGCDIGQRAEAERVVAEAAQRFSRLDIVVHNAAINPRAKLESLQEQALDDTLAVNLKACFHLARATLPH